MHALMKLSSGNATPRIVNWSVENFSPPPVASLISGLRNAEVSPPTTPAKAAPITTPTAISTTFPRRMNFLNPSNIAVPLQNRSAGNVCQASLEVKPLERRVVGQSGFLLRGFSWRTMRFNSLISQREETQKFQGWFCAKRVLAWTPVLRFSSASQYTDTYNHRPRLAAVAPPTAHPSTPAALRWCPQL